MLYTLEKKQELLLTLSDRIFNAEHFLPEKLF